MSSILKHMYKNTLIKKTISLATVSTIVFLFLSLDAAETYAMVLTTTDEALNSVLRDAREIKKEVKFLTREQKNSIFKKTNIEFDSNTDNGFQFFIGSTNGRIVGYAVTDTVEGKWGPINYIVSFNPSGTIRNVLILEHKERRGKPVAKRRFLNQFKNKTVSDKIKLKKDIQGISGATISSSCITNGVRKLVHVFNELYLKNN